MTLAERIVERVARATSTDRRGFLRGATVVGAALATSPWTYVSRPASAYDTVCGADNTCAAGYSAFCCTINNGANSCPPDSFIGGWWKADSSSFCGGSARYYIDCNAYRPSSTWSCHCNDSTCDQRLVACNQFRYGQCNPQIPYSSTGPVVCRVISCTPPWQQFQGVCSSSSATDNNTATHSAPCLNDAVPIGSLDSATVTGNAVRLVGWAYDPDHPDTEIQLAVYSDGSGVGVFPSGVSRPDVDSAYRISGNHGFDITVTLPGGSHTVQLYALNAGPGTANPMLASRQLVVNPGAAPVGSLDSVTGSGTTVRLVGWADDADDASRAISVAVYEDGAGVGTFPTGKPRPDVQKALGVQGDHGFDITLTRPSGVHQYRVYALSVGGGDNALVGSKTFEVNPGVAPRGSLDSATVIGDDVRLRGWAYDPDEPSASCDVVVYVDGAGLSRFRADSSRPDVDSAYGITGNHGFDVTVRATPGSRTFDVYAVNLGGGATNPRIGTRTVSVGAPGPIGSIDDASVTGTTLRLRGWALDGDQPGTAISVDVSVDGTSTGTFPTGVPRPDVDRAYDVPGDHGFDLSTTLSPGTHTIAVRAVGKRAKPLLGQRTITVGGA